MVSIFSDKATIMLRAMIAEPNRKWVVRDFVREFGVSQGRVSSILKVLRKKGFVSGISSGRTAYSKLENPGDLLKEWLRYYTFELNQVYLYYSHESKILELIKRYFKERELDDKYALALHTGANFITHYVRTDSIYCYIAPEHFNEISLNMRQALNIKELKTGGNIFLIKPYYKQSVFFQTQKIRGYNIVSNLQLYLDLYSFAQRGRQHADYLLEILKEEGKSFV